MTSAPEHDEQSIAGGSVKQSRLMSLVEATTNVVVGFLLALLTQIVVFPLLGLSASLSDNLILGVIFTAVSLLRSYALRRLFNAIQVGAT
jgi:hypothetical protein